MAKAQDPESRLSREIRVRASPRPGRTHVRSPSLRSRPSSRVSKDGLIVASLFERTQERLLTMRKKITPPIAICGSASRWPSFPSGRGGMPRHHTCGISGSHAIKSSQNFGGTLRAPACVERDRICSARYRIQKIAETSTACASSRRWRDSVVLVDISPPKTAPLDHRQLQSFRVARLVQ